MIPAFPKPSQTRRVPKFLGDDGVYRYPDGREICDQKSKKGRDEYQSRKFKMYYRQRSICNLQIHVYCKQRQGCWPKSEIQFDHEAGRTSGKQDDRIEVLDPETGKIKWQNAAVCAWCNTLKGSQRMPYIVDAP